MYVNIGGGFALRRADIVAVFDMDNATWSRITRGALALAEKRGEVINAAEDIPRSFIICEENGVRKIYLSQLSSAAVARRGSAAGALN
ncbi:MAG TPA: DUF370 domain-containing protein [Candidatus Scatomorpha merdipullorum]|uniref:DUF370 domain-containing protein n=1 Tax=Candidatus Scatomorpha merdipullorum TaxID=2840927 RepID=A0A9D1FDW5_9FIRM|nr:DUF370 domain-containing protein [Candidatus Scatomorpha merdipullorum]